MYVYKDGGIHVCTMYMYECCLSGGDFWFLIHVAFDSAPDRFPETTKFLADTPDLTLVLEEAPRKLRRNRLRGF